MFGGQNYMYSYHMLQFKYTDAGHLLHFMQGRKLEYMYEHMATVRSLDVVNLPKIGPYTTMSIPRDDFPNQSKR